MPNRRRTARKLKRSINKAKIKVKRAPDATGKKQDDKNLNENMMLKLMALFGNKGQQSMDPATFLRMQEEKASRDNEIRKTKLETKQIKGKNAEDEQKHKLTVAQMERDEAQRDAQYNAELLKLQEETAGVQGEIKVLNAQIEDAKHQQRMNAGKVDLEALKALRDTKERELKNIMASINYKAKGFLTPEIDAILKGAIDTLDRFTLAVNDLEKAIVLGETTLTKKKLVKKLADELGEKMGELLDQKVRTELVIKQNEDDIKTDEERVKKARDLQRENNELQHTMKRTEAEAKRAGYTFKRDELGNVIKEVDESMLVPEIVPDNNEHVKYYRGRLKELTDYLNYHIATPPEGTTWKDLIQNDFKGYEQEGRSVESRYNELPADQRTFKGVVLNSFSDVVAYFKQTCHDEENAVKEASKEFEFNKSKNEAVRNNPMPVPVKITDDDIAKLERVQDEKKNVIENNKQQTKFARDRRMEYEKLSNDIRRLEAELRNIPREEVSEAQWNLLAQLNKQREELERTIDIQNRRRKRVQKVEDDTADLQFRNTMDSKLAAVSSKSKKRLEEEEQKAIEAQVAAEYQKQLNERINATHKAEQDLRSAEMRENAERSDKVKETQDKITQERAKQVVAEAQKQELEELQRVRKNTRDKIVTLEAQQQLNAYAASAGSNSIQDTTTMLTVVGDMMDKQTTALDQLHKTAKPFIDRFKSNPEQLEAFNKLQESEGQPTYKTADAVLAAIGHPFQVQCLSKFFQSYDGNATGDHERDSNELLDQ